MSNVIGSSYGVSQLDIPIKTSLGSIGSISISWSFINISGLQTYTIVIEVYSASYSIDWVITAAGGGIFSCPQGIGNIVGSYSLIAYYPSLLSAYFYPYFSFLSLLSSSLPLSLSLSLLYAAQSILSLDKLLEPLNSRFLLGTVRSYYYSSKNNGTSVLQPR